MVWARVGAGEREEEDGGGIRARGRQRAGGGGCVCAGRAALVGAWVGGARRAGPGRGGPKEGAGRGRLGWAEQLGGAAQGKKGRRARPEGKRAGGGKREG